MKRVLAPDEVDKLLGTFTKAPTSIRNKALIVVMWRAGLRISEALALHPKDLDPEAGRITVREGKGKKPRVVAMGSLSWDVLDEWMRVRRKRGLGSSTKPVFCTLDGDELKGAYVRAMLKRKATSAGIDPERVHPHAFRHAFAVDMHKAGKPIEHLRRLLGHANLAVTTHYLARIDPEEALDSARSLDGDDAPSEVALLRAEVARLAARLDQAA
jgi:site-specific recombinase XerD